MRVTIWTKGPESIAINDSDLCSTDDDWDVMIEVKALRGNVLETVHMEMTRAQARKLGECLIAMRNPAEGK